MTHGLTYNDEERDARRAARSAKAIERNERRRMKALRFVEGFEPMGTGAVSGAAPLHVLLQLESRGLVERSYVLTSDGRRKLAADDPG